MMDNCIFCKIIRKEIPSKIVYENEYVIAFEDLNPMAPIHILVVPKKHFDDITKVNGEDYIYIEEIFKAMRKIADDKQISESGFRIVNNCGKDSGQSVMHMHFHLLGGRSLEVKMA